MTMGMKTNMFVIISVFVWVGNLAANPFDKGDWSVRCWSSEKKLWEEHDLAKMTIVNEGGVAIVSNTSGIHKHAHLVFPAAPDSDFTFTIELKGGYELGFLNRAGKDEMLYIELGEAKKFETFELSRQGTRFSITRNGRALPLVHFRFDYGEEFVITLAIKAGESAEIKSYSLDGQNDIGKTFDPDELFVATPWTKSGLFTAGIEGPACDREGNLYAVSFGDKRSIGRITPGGKAESWITLPEGSTGNGIRFNRAGEMFVADYTGHNVLKVDPQTKEVTVFAHEPTMHQPNDLAIGPDGTLYASDPDWKNKDGALWKISPDGKVSKLADDQGTTNGIEVSPDGKTLYVAESKQRRVEAWDLVDTGLANERILIEFEEHGLDGMRCDVDGNLYITRHGAGEVLKLSGEGKVLKTIPLPGSMPSNLCFGGPDGKTVYVTEVENRQVLRFRADRPGLAWQRWQESR